FSDGSITNAGTTTLAGDLALVGSSVSNQNSGVLNWDSGNITLSTSLSTSSTASIDNAGQLNIASANTLGGDSSSTFTNSGTISKTVDGDSTISVTLTSTGGHL